MKPRALDTALLTAMALALVTPGEAASVDKTLAVEDEKTCKDGVDQLSADGGDCAAPVLIGETIKAPDDADASSTLISPLRAGSEMTATGRMTPREDSVIPDGVSALVNTSLIYTRSESKDDFFESQFDELLLNLEPAARFDQLGGFVVRSEARLRWRSDGSFPAPPLPDAGETDFQRGATVLMKDFPDSAIRLQIGDVFARPVALQNSARLLGFNLSRDYQRIQPFRNVLPTDRRSFFLERPSRVQIYADDTLVDQRFLGSGFFDINQFAAELGNQRIELEIRDDTGRTETLKFAALTALPLLAEGALDFSIAGGFFTTTRDGNLKYDFDEPQFSGFMQYGVTNNLNFGIDVQADQYDQAIGASTLVATSIGTFGVRSALSRNDQDRFGAGVGASYASPIAGRLPRIGLDFEYRGLQFAPLGTSNLVSGPFVTSLQNEIAMNAYVSETIGRRLAVTTGGDWRRLRESMASGPQDDEWSAYVAFDFTLAKGLAAGVNLSADSYDGDEVTYAALLRLRRHFGSKRSASLIHNTRNNSTAATATQDSMGFAHRRFSQARIEFREGDEDHLRLSADIDYEANRFTAYGYHFEDRTLGGGGVSRDSFIQVNSAIAFADGAVAIGKQVNGSGFSIVRNFDKAPGDRIYVDDWGGNEYRARSSGLGPALVSDLTAYVNDKIDVSTRVDNGTSPAGVEDGSGGLYDRFIAYPLPYGGVVYRPLAPPCQPDEERDCPAAEKQPDETGSAAESDAMPN